MKTHDAFAFRDFDAARILQRPYFRQWRERRQVSEDATDEEIVARLKVYYSDLQLTETKHAMLTELLARLDGFLALIQRHANAMDGRLERYRRSALKEKNSFSFQARIDRADELAKFYIVDAVRAVGDLKATVAGIWRDSEQDLQGEYRRRFGERLKAAREKAGMSRKELAEVVNISPNGFGLYETGKRDVTIATLIRLSRKLNVSSDWLIGLN